MCCLGGALGFGWGGAVRSQDGSLDLKEKTSPAWKVGGGGRGEKTQVGSTGT